MNTTALGVILCLGYSNGEVYIYNISEAEPVMEIHSRLSTVTALLLLCADSNDRDTVGDGVLLIGYDDGFVEAFNCKSGERMMARQCHQGTVEKLVTFGEDYYVFSVGADHAVCSFLVYSQLVTMKTVQDLLADNTTWSDAARCGGNGNHRNRESGGGGGVRGRSGGVGGREEGDGRDGRDDSDGEIDEIRVNWYRGHGAPVYAVYRNEWCLLSDLVCVGMFGCCAVVT